MRSDWSQGISLPDEGTLSNTVVANNSVYYHTFVRIVDLLLANGTWDDLTDCEFNHVFYSATLKRFQLRMCTSNTNYVDEKVKLSGSQPWPIEI